MSLLLAFIYGRIGTQCSDNMDANNDGVVTKAEAKGPLARDFERLDADEDGQLTMAELKNISGPRGPK